jgi:hypothetical protein
MCLLLAQLKTGFFSIFFAAAVYSTNEANKAGLKQSIFLDVYDKKPDCSYNKSVLNWTQVGQLHINPIARNHISKKS